MVNLNKMFQQCQPRFPVPISHATCGIIDSLLTSIHYLICRHHIYWNYYMNIEQSSMALKKYIYEIDDICMMTITICSVDIGYKSGNETTSRSVIYINLHNFCIFDQYDNQCSNVAITASSLTVTCVASWLIARYVVMPMDRRYMERYDNWYIKCIFIVWYKVLQDQTDFTVLIYHTKIVWYNYDVKAACENCGFIEWHESTNYLYLWHFKSSNNTFHYSNGPYNYISGNRLEKRVVSIVESIQS